MTEDADHAWDDRASWVPPPSEEYQKAHGWKNGKPLPGSNGHAGDHHSTDDAKEPDTLVLINPADLADKLVPAREWIVEDWLPVGATTACYGDGGVGKTLLAQQLMTATSIGSVWW